MKRWTDILAELSAAGPMTERDLSTARTSFILDLLDSEDFWNADPQSQAALISEMSQAPPLQKEGVRGYLQNIWNRLGESMTQMGSMTGMGQAAALENLIEGAVSAVGGEPYEMTWGGWSPESLVQRQQQEALKGGQQYLGLDTTVPVGLGQNIASGLASLPGALAKMAPYVQGAAAALPASPVAAGALGFGAFGAQEALNAELPLDEVAKEALIQAGLGSVIGLAGKIPNAAVRSAVEAGVFGGESAVQSGLEGQYGEGGDTGAAVANALIAAGIPLGMHGMKRLMTGAKPETKPTAKPAPEPEPPESVRKSVQDIKGETVGKPPVEEVTVEEAPGRTDAEFKFIGKRDPLSSQKLDQETILNEFLGDPLKQVARETTAGIPTDPTEYTQRVQSVADALVPEILAGRLGDSFTDLVAFAHKLTGGQGEVGAQYTPLKTLVSQALFGAKDAPGLRSTVQQLREAGLFKQDSELAAGGPLDAIRRRMARLYNEIRTPGMIRRAKEAGLKGRAKSEALEALRVSEIQALEATEAQVTKALHEQMPDLSEIAPPDPYRDLSVVSHARREGGSVALPNSELTRQNIAREMTSFKPVVKAAMNDPGLAQQISSAVERSGANINKTHQAINRVLISTWGRLLYFFGGQDPKRFLRETAVTAGEDLYPETFADLIQKYGGDINKARAELYGSAGPEGKNTVYRGMYTAYGRDMFVPENYARRMISLFTAADSETFRHEIGHMMYDLLPEQSKQILHSAVGVGKTLDRDGGERVAEYLRAHIESGIPVKGMEGEYARVRAWVRSLAEQGKKTGALEIVHPEVQQELMNLASVSPDLTRSTPDMMADLSEPEPGTFRSGIGGKAVLKYVKENTSDPFKYPEFRALGKKLQRPTHLSTLKPRTFTLTRGGRGVTGATLKFKVYKTANPNGLLDEAGEPLFPPGATGTGAPKAFYQLVHRDGGESVAFAGAVDAGAALRDGLQETGLTRRKVQERISDFFSFVSEKWGLASEKNSDFFRELDEMEIPDPANPGQTYRPGREFLAGLSADVVRREDGHFELQPRASRERSLLAQWMDDTVRPLDRKIIGLLGTSGKKLVLLAEAATHRTRQLSRPIMDKLDQILHGLSAQEIAEFAAATAVEAKPEDLSPKALEAYRKWHSDSDGAGLFSSRRMALEARGHADTPLEQLLYQRHSILRLVKRHVLQRIRKGFMTLEDWKEWDGEDGKRNDARMAFAQLLDLTRDKLDRMSPEEIANIQKNLRDLRIPVSAMESNPGPMVSRIATEAAKAKAWAANGGEAYRAYTELLQTLEPGSEEWRSVKEHQRQSLDRSGAGDKDMYISNAPFFRKAQQWAVMGALTGRAILANAMQPVLWIPQYGPRKWTEALLRTIKWNGRTQGLQRKSAVQLGGIFQIPGSTAALDRVSKIHPFGRVEAFVRGFAKNLADIEVKDLKERAKQGDKMAMRDLEKFVADVGRFLREGVEEALEPGAISEQEVASLALAERLALSMRSTSVPAKWVTSDLWKALTTLKRFPLQQYLQVKDALWGDFQEARKAGAEKDGSLKKQYQARLVKRLMGYGITGAASGFIVNTIWNALKGTADQSVLWKSQHLDDNDRNDLLEISEMYGKSLIDSGLTGWLADVLGDISRHFYGKDVGIADSALGFNLSRLQEAIGFAGDLTEGMLQAADSVIRWEGKGEAARNLGAKTWQFAERTIPATKAAEFPRNWGGRGLGDVLNPAKEADRLRKGINEAVKSGDRRQTRKLLEQYRRAALRNLSGAETPEERRRWANTLKRMKGLTSRPRRGTLGG